MLVYTEPMSGTDDKTFYLETFGCQMNVHDSEKVIGTLVQVSISASCITREVSRRFGRR